ncbi:MAG: GTP 3',8-cyclase MoaA [Candidatus Fermentibacteraceae bacterium]|nr:GTP 3',8-cyclase MoaA [Candidatus Fermentibacteraceae bacterium]
MKDRYGRVIDYLRVSVTDRCNLRCIYCMPEEGIPYIEHSAILRLEEIQKLVELIHQALNLRKIRVTGGEPLVRRGVVSLVKAISPLAETVMTTNGVLLSEFASDLRAAGLSRVNISLDSLKDDVIRKVTRRDVTLSSIERAIESAMRSGLTPVKVNCVVLKGVNTGELADMVGWAEDIGVTMRFIEHMPMTGSACSYVPGNDILKEISVDFGEVRKTATVGTADIYTTPSGIEFGLIAPVAGGMCASCTRLRLTAEGELLPCLAGGVSLDLRDMLRSGAEDLEMVKAVHELVARKPHHGACGGVSMWRIGG